MGIVGQRCELLQLRERCLTGVLVTHRGESSNSALLRPIRALSPLTGGGALTQRKIQTDSRSNSGSGNAGIENRSPRLPLGGDRTSPRATRFASTVRRNPDRGHSRNALALQPDARLSCASRFAQMSPEYRLDVDPLSHSIYPYYFSVMGGATLRATQQVPNEGRGAEQFSPAAAHESRRLGRSIMAKRPVLSSACIWGVIRSPLAPSLLLRGCPLA